MALSALQPTVGDFMDTLIRGRHGEQIMVELEVTSESPLVGTTLREALSLTQGVTVLGLHKKSADTVTVGPRPDEVLEVGDRLMLLGEEEDLERLSRPVTASAG
jgi:Trk K+ transport system NAD-binding subunit